MARSLAGEACEPRDEGREVAHGLRSVAALALLALLTAVSGSAGDAPVSKDAPATKEAPILKVVDADPQTGVKLTTSVAAVSLRLPLELDSGAVKGVTASVDDFIAPNATRIRPNVTLNGKPAGRPIDVTQKERPILEIAATFPVAGEYTSHIVLFYSGKRVGSVPLSVTRQRSEVTVQIDGLDTVTTTKWLTADAKVRFTVRETSGQRITLYPPALEGLALKVDDKVRKQAHYREISVDGRTSPVPAKAAQESYVVEPLQGRPAIVEIRKIEEAGEYLGTIRLAGSNGTPVTKEVTVLVKTSGWVAAFWIFLGVLASFAIRRYTKQQRPKLQALRRLRYAENDLERVRKDAGAPADPAPAVFQGLVDRLSRIERELEDGTAKDGAAADLAEVEKKIRALPGWLTTGRKLDAVQPADVVQTPRAAWEALADSYFLDPEAKEEITASLLAIEKGIEEAVSERLKEFSTSVEAYKTAHQAAEGRIDREVTPLLTKAKAAVKAKDWTGLTTHLREARLAYTRVLAGELEEAVKAAQPPLGLDVKSWPELRDKITAALARIQQETDPDRAEEIYQSTNRTYLNAVAGKLKDLVAALVKTTANAEEQKQLGGASAALTASALAAQKSDWDTARAEYQKAAEAVTAMLDARTKAGAGAQGAAGSQTAARFGEPVPAGAAVGTVQPLGAVPPRQKSTAQQISDALERYDLALNVALLLIACAVGLSLLWWTDPVWGGWKSYTTALLWGLGLHQVAGSSLDGLPAISKKLTEEKEE